MSAMELTWALLYGAILLIALLALGLFWQELRVRYGQEAMADMQRRLVELRAANEGLRRENQRLRIRLQVGGNCLAAPSAAAGEGRPGDPFPGAEAGPVGCLTETGTANQRTASLCTGGA